MAINKEKWTLTYWQNEIPELPCPNCTSGFLKQLDGSFQSKTSKQTDLMVEEGVLDPCDQFKQFVLFLQCAGANCGQVVSVLGVAEPHERWIPEIETRGYELKLRPKGMSPAPPLISIPPNTPEGISDEISLAFHLFWVDLGSCANRLRVSLERLLDHQKIKKRVPKSKPKPDKRKTRDLNLAERIDAYEGTASQSRSKESILHALRTIGNTGSHEGDVERNQLLNAFQIYETALNELYGQNMRDTKAIAKQLNTKRGRKPRRPMRQR